ncbi:PEP-CTERM sorting domain-containing protein [Luteolibacter pohnpeiensis]|uniref:PEP-CTERM sorting domain-containing protein n=1 Tax=Luteolibacter pohnpeiensis TaxID=454153 RepID=A0A934S4I5_9BACT|nr:PEP-CTERM sorting domain-containing protein [Luteolibacter pohnpeiensis]MBK1881758.1 PEP-CTERM sorting domain-containing protein [Luteolibacter pohnpeiensis]
MKISKLLLGAVALAIAISSAAHGQTLTATLTEVSPGTTVYGTVDGNFYQDWVTGVTAFDKFDGFCVQPAEHLSYGETVVYDIQDASTLTNSAIVAKLIGGYLASDMSPAQASAVQWAIWEVLAETSGTYSLYDGNVMITSDTEIADLANNYLTNVDSYTPADLTYYTNDTIQNVVSWQTIPEPATLGLVALSGLVFLRRRR